MEINLESLAPAKAYAVLAGLVTPRPIALVTTVDPGGIVNAAPFSFFNVMGANPPIVAFAPGDRDDGTPKDTARNIALTHEFVVNLVDESIADAMNRCAEALPYGVSEIDVAGLTIDASSVVKPPRIHEAPVSLECAEWSTLQIGGNRLVIGTVRRVHVRDGLFDPATGRIRVDRLRLIGRLTAEWYCRTTDRFALERIGREPRVSRGRVRRR